MTNTSTYVFAFLSLWGSTLKAQDSLEQSVDSISSNDSIWAEEIVVDTLDVNDSIWMDDVAFANSLIIPSYEELLEVYYESVVTVDKRLNFNVFRYKPDMTDKVNPFKYHEVIFTGDSVDRLDDLAAIGVKDDPFAKDADQVLVETRAYVSQQNPQLITTTWDLLPDPPKAEKADIIYSFDIDISAIDTGFNHFKKPEKIKKLKYAYLPWNKKLVASLSANQTSFSNWAKGGDNQFAIAANVIADIDYQSFDKKTRWENNIESRLGYIHNEGKSFVKNLDLIRINTQFAHNAINKWFYAFNSEFSTQFFDGFDMNSDTYDDPISALLSPAYLTISLGLDYKYATKKNKKLFSVQASPLSYKMTLVADTSRISQQNFGVDVDKRSRQEVGGSVSVTSEYSVSDKFLGKSKLSLFSNYVENPQNIDMTWNTTMTYNFSRIFAVNFSLDMLYDDDTDILLAETDDGTKTYGQRLQVKEYLGFSLTYRFF